MKCAGLNTNMPMPKFEPTDAQREIVAALAAAKTPLEKIAAAIFNPRTNRPISVKVLCRLFKEQLTAKVDALVQAYRNLKKLLDSEDWQATRYVFDHLAEFKAMEKNPATPAVIQEEIKNIQVNFVGSPHADEPEVGPGPSEPIQHPYIPGSPRRLLEYHSAEAEPSTPKAESRAINTSLSSQNLLTHPTMRSIRVRYSRRALPAVAQAETQRPAAQGPNPRPTATQTRQEWLDGLVQ